MDRMIIDMTRARRRITVWTPWGMVPADKNRAAARPVEADERRASARPREARPAGSGVRRRARRFDN